MYCTRASTLVYCDGVYCSRLLSFYVTVHTYWYIPYTVGFVLKIFELTRSLLVSTEEPMCVLFVGSESKYVRTIPTTYVTLDYYFFQSPIYFATLRYSTS